MMTNTELESNLEALGLTPKTAAEQLSVDLKTMQRWLSGKVPVPGPAEQAIRAWRRLDAQGLAWRQNEHRFMTEEDFAQQAKLHRQHTIDLDATLRKVEARGGPVAPWKVDLKGRGAVLGEMTVSFYVLQTGSFSLSSYSRTDMEPDPERDRPLIEDAVACIAAAIKKAGPDWAMRNG
ncbi:MAG: hypothetical protein ACT7A5_20500 [Ferrovibrionaceae bacterium]